MTKMEFAIKLEEYQKRHYQKKWLPLVIGIILWSFVFFPAFPLYLDDNMFGLNAVAFSLLGTLCLLKAWSYHDVTEEHRLLIDALGLIPTANKDTKQKDHDGNFTR